MILHQSINIHIAQTVAVGKHKIFVTRVFEHPAQTAGGLGFDSLDPPGLPCTLTRWRMVYFAGIIGQVYRYIRIVHEIIEEISLIIQPLYPQQIMNSLCP